MRLKVTVACGKATDLSTFLVIGPIFLLLLRFFNMPLGFSVYFGCKVVGIHVVHPG